MANKVVYTPFISKPISESKANEPIPISFPISEYQGVNPDREVISINYVSKPQIQKEEPEKINFWEQTLSDAKKTLSIRNTSYNESIWNEVFEKYGSQLGLKDEKAYIYLLGQIKHESSDFKHMKELASGDAYEGNTNLGNTQKGDGRRFKGRGPIHVTGRYNYEKIYNDFFIPNGLDEYNVVKDPDLGNDPKIGSLLTIGWLLTTSNGRKAIEAANRYDIRSLTKAINGGNNGLVDRERWTKRLLREYNLST